MVRSSWGASRAVLFVRVVSCVALSCVALSVVGCVEEPPPITGATDELDVRSEIVGDDFRILLRLPPGYDARAEDALPAVFQLDATRGQFDLVAGQVSELEAAGAIEPTVVVGIGYPYDDPLIGGERGRSRDYVATGIDDFLAFVDRELLPELEGRVRLDPERRVLSGHSLGGFVALRSLLASSEDPLPTFRGFIANDPSLGEGEGSLFVLEEQTRASADGSPRRVYFAIARYNGAVQELFFEELRERLVARDALAVETTVFDTDHGGVLAPAYRAGLEAMLGAAGTKR